MLEHQLVQSLVKPAMMDVPLPFLIMDGGYEGVPITVTRASTKLLMGPAGVFYTVPINAQPHEWEPGGAYIGRLYEEERTNEALHSNAFDNAVWTKTRISVAASGTHWILSEDGTAANSHLVNDSVPSSPVAEDTTVVFSIDMKASNRTQGTIRTNNYSNNSMTSYVNLSTGATISEDADHTIASINLGDGWYRYNTIFDSGNTATTAIQLLFGPAVSGNQIFDGLSQESILARRAQLEEGDIPSSWISTGATAVTRAADVTTAPFTFATDVGTIFAEASIPHVTDETRHAVSINNGTTGQSINIGLSTAGNGRPKGSMSGETPAFAQSTGVDWANGETIKMALAYQIGPSTFSAKGALATSVTITGLPTQSDQIDFGSAQDGTLVLNGHMLCIKNWLDHRPDIELQAITA